MSSSSLPFEGVRVAEVLSTSCPPLVARTIAVGGQLARQFGASVSSPAGAGTSDSFLSRGKDLRSQSDAVSAWLERGAPSIMICDSEGLEEMGGALFGGASSPSMVEVTASALPGTDLGSVTEFNVLLLSGLLDVVGDAGGPPTMLGGRQISYSAGSAVFTAISIATASHRLRGMRNHFRIDVCDVAAWVNWKAILSEKISGSPIRREGGISHWPVMRCRDGYMAIVYEDRDWSHLVEIIGTAKLQPLKHLIAEERTPVLPIINKELAAWCATLTRAEIYRSLQAKGIPSGPVLTPHELTTDPVLTERRFWESYEDEGQARLAPRAPITWNDVRLEEMGSSSQTAEMLFEVKSN